LGNTRKQVAGEPLTPELIAELEAITAEGGCELLHAEFKGGVLRLVLDRLGGAVSLADCEVVSKQASALLDVVDFGPGRYTLEVSSPGLDRRLYGRRDYQRFTGKRVRVTYRTPEEARRTVIGRLTAFRSAGGGEIDVAEGGLEEGAVLTVPLERVEMTRLVPEI
jgi:ribosome maturation factor RimP